MDNERKTSEQTIKKRVALSDILAERRHWHPSIVFGYFDAPGHIYVEPGPENLVQHIPRSLPISMCGLADIFSELVNAVFWLEQLGIFHGDVRPSNILVDHHRHIKLCNFEDALFFGERITNAVVPYYTQSEGGSFGVAKSGSEQGAIACCAYFVGIGIEPQDRSENLIFINVAKQALWLLNKTTWQWQNVVKSHPKVARENPA
ncbi:MAG: hypothetical protein Q9221_008552 [Calogaya cf. arnoldii]